MYKKLFFTAFLLQLIIPGLFSQEIVKVPDFGKIDIADLKMKDCDFENGVPAMHLLKFEDVSFTSSGNSYYMVVTQKRYRTKIFNTNGFKYASIAISYAGGDKDFKISDVEAVTYNIDENGQVKTSVLNTAEIFKDKGQKKKSMTSIRFTLPDVKVGCVIEYRYTVTEKQSKYIAPWYFQDDIPNLLSACKITMPQKSSLGKRFIGVDSVKEGTGYDDSKNVDKWKNIKSFAVQNVPSFKSEAFMSSPNDYKQRVVFNLDPFETEYEATLKETNGSWQQLNISLLASPIGWQFNSAIEGTESFIDSAKNLKAISEKVNAVYNYVKKQIKWDDYYSVYPGDIQSVWNDKEGSSSEINLLILNLLRKTGVDCYPLVFSTRNHGKTDYNFASLSQFNSVDILVFDGDIFYILDGTSKHLPYYVPPYNILFRDAFIIDPKYSKWVNIADSRSLIHDSVSVIAKIEDEGLLKGETIQTFYDLSKAIKSEDDENKDDDNEDDDKNSLIASEIKTDTSYQINKDSDLLPLIEATKFHYELPSTDEFYFLSPFLFSGLSKNPFTDSIRRSDIDFGSGIIHKVHMEIAVPKNITVEELMRNKTIRTSDTSMMFSCMNEYKNDTLFINSTFEIKYAIFLKEDYEMVRQFFKNVYTLLNNQILLKRKEQ